MLARARAEIRMGKSMKPRRTFSDQRRFLPWLLVVMLGLTLIPGLATAQNQTTSGTIAVRDDGLTTIVNGSGAESEVQYLTLLIKTGYSQDPAAKAGLTDLTNILVYRILQMATLLDFNYFLAADYSRFDFAVPNNDFTAFCRQLDAVIRIEALLSYDECNILLKNYRNLPRNPSEVGLAKLYTMIDGAGHPYTKIFDNYMSNLDITDANNWFRRIYRPSNLIISSTAPLPDDFLLRPSGREMKQVITKSPVPAATCSPNPLVEITTVHNSTASVFIGLPAPALTDPDLATSLLVQQYLAWELWNKLREQAGYCYDVSVFHSYLTEPVAPILLIEFETLPGNAGPAIGQVISVLQGIAKNGIPEAELTSLKQAVEKQAKRIGDSRRTATQNLALQAFFNQTWLSDYDAYSKLLAGVTSADTARLIRTKLGSIKLSLTGPEETQQALVQLQPMLQKITTGLEPGKTGK